MEITEKEKITPPKRNIKELLTFGIINIDKPPGPTSHQTADYTKQILNIDKAGHGGSLDPKRTGVLPTFLQKATRLSHLLLKGKKEYVGTLYLHEKTNKDKIKNTIKEHFTGTITQKPPIKSSVKRKARKRKIHQFKILEVKEQDVLFKISCEAGTYIRKICHDLGEKLGIGAHMTDLRRTKASNFTEENSTTLHELKDAYTFWKENHNTKEIEKHILPPEKAIQKLPKTWIYNSAIESISNGMDLAIPGINKTNPLKEGEETAILDRNNKLIALGTATKNTEEIQEEDQGIAIQTEKVFKE